jgi:cell division protein FtsB
VVEKLTLTFEQTTVKIFFYQLNPSFFFTLSLSSEINTMLKILKIVFLNRYTITLLLFAAWMIFFDANSLKRQHILNGRIDEIKQMKAFYVAEIEKNNKAIYELETNIETIEKYAREKYMMKRDSEDVYMVTRE